MIHRYTLSSFIRELVLIAGAVLVALPFYLLVVVSLKPTEDVASRPLAFPTSPEFGNYSEITQIGSSNIMSALTNSLIITGGALALTVVIASTCAYALVRNASRLSSILLSLFLLAIMLPLQLVVLPLYTQMRSVGLLGTYAGTILLYAGLFTPFAVFLYSGFIKSLPREFEEAAQVDGANFVRTYVRIVFPMLWPVTTTVGVLVGLMIWNDFFVGVIFLSGSERQTLPVALYALVEQTSGRWELIFAGVMVALAPAILFYAVAQRKIVNGLAGGLKG